MDYYTPLSLSLSFSQSAKRHTHARTKTKQPPYEHMHKPEALWPSQITAIMNRIEVFCMLNDTLAVHDTTCRNVHF